jgi:hypothetical protein
MLWRFHEIVLPNLTGTITEWLTEIGPPKRQTKVRQKLRARLLGMQNLNQTQWPLSWTKKLVGYRHIFELRFEVWNVQYRPLFYYGIGQQIIFAFPALEIGDQFVPSDAPARAEARRLDVIAGRSNTYEIDPLSLV